MKPGTLKVTLAAAATLWCSAAAAQQSLPPPVLPDTYHTNPTPEEMAQTKALNDKQAAIRGLSASGETGSAIDAHDQEVQKKYQDELRANEEQHNLYLKQMEEYERKYGHPGGAGKPAKS